MPVKQIGIAIGFVLLASCASMPSGQSERAEYVRQDHINRFNDYVEDCERRGGVVIIQRKMMSSRRSLPSRHDAYSCQFNNRVGIGVGL